MISELAGGSELKKNPKKILKKIKLPIDYDFFN